jgi:hypothetical protein
MRNMAKCTRHFKVSKFNYLRLTKIGTLKLINQLLIQGTLAMLTAPLPQSRQDKKSEKNRKGASKAKEPGKFPNFTCFIVLSTFELCVEQIS